MAKTLGLRDSLQAACHIVGHHDLLESVVGLPCYAIWSAPYN